MLQLYTTTDRLVVYSCNIHLVGQIR